VTDEEKLGRIKACIEMIQCERRKPKRKRIVGLIGACLHEMEGMLSAVEAIYAIEWDGKAGAQHKAG
jgi:hypothetical protein